MYKYYFRPGYKSKKLLIDIFDGAEKDTFFSDFIGAITEINPKVSDVSDLWMNDEITFEFDSQFGKFTFFKDIWGFAFIMAENNQNCLVTISSLLERSELFEKTDVDFENYK